MNRRMGLGALGAALLTLADVCWPHERARSVSVEQAPPAWIAYAQRVSQRFEVALAGDSKPAQRFHAYFEQGSDAVSSEPDALPPMLRVKTWLDARGHVTRVEFPALGDAQAEADLRAVLLAQSIGARPPRRMTQPVVVRLALGAEL